MSLKKGLRLYSDFVLATDATWLKLCKVFGGGVKIGISLIDAREDRELQISLAMSLRDKDDRNRFISQKFNDTPDLDPITVPIISDCCEDQSKGLNYGYLVSRYITPKAFLNIFSESIGFIPTKSRLFMVVPDSEVPAVLHSGVDSLTVQELPTREASQG